MRGGSYRSRRPRELYEEPASRWVADFVGDVNIFEGQIESQARRGRLLIATRDAGTIAVTPNRASR